MTTTHNKFTDQELIVLINKNDEVAIATFLNRYKNKFYTTVYFIVKDHYVADDIFQDGCIKIIHLIRNGKYNEDGKFLPWAMRIIRNLAMDYLRQEKRLPKITFPDGTDIFSVLEFEDSPVMDEIHLEKTGNQAKEMLLKLSNEQREVITLRIFGNLSFNEIAKITDVSVNTALGRMRYGLINLRKAMEEKGVVL
jgi:RNA polymerase sigma-70 factor (ECF subfamily)